MTMKTSKISKKRGPSLIGSNTGTSSSSSSSCARYVADIGNHGLPILSVVSYHDELIVARFFPCYGVNQTVCVFCALSSSASPPLNICFFLVHQLCLYAQKLKLSFSWLFWVRIFCMRSFPSLLRFCSFQSMIFSSFFWYHISVVCNHCKTLLVRK